MIVRDSDGNARIIPTPLDPFASEDSTPPPPRQETVSDLSTLLGLVSTLFYLFGVNP